MVNHQYIIKKCYPKWLYYSQFYSNIHKYMAHMRKWNRTPKI